MSQSEKHFLMSENRALGWAELNGLNIPDSILAGIIERRAKRVGPEVLRQFRTETPKRTQSLEQKINASKLW